MKIWDFAVRSQTFANFCMFLCIPILTPIYECSHSSRTSLSLGYWIESNWTWCLVCEDVSPVGLVWASQTDMNWWGPLDKRAKRLHSTKSTFDSVAQRYRLSYHIESSSALWSATTQRFLSNESLSAGMDVYWCNIAANAIIHTHSFKYLLVFSSFSAESPLQNLRQTPPKFTFLTALLLIPTRPHLFKV